MKKHIHRHSTKLPRLVAVTAVVGAIGLIVSGHGPGRWFYEGLIEIAEFVEPLVIMLLEL